MYCNRCGTEARPGQRACAGCGLPLAVDESGADTGADTDAETDADTDADTGADTGTDTGERTQPIDVADAESDHDAGERTQPIDVVGTESDHDAGERTQPIDVVDDTPPTQPIEVGAAFPPPGEPPSESPPSDPDPDPAPEPVARPVAVPPRLYDLALDEPDLLRDPAPAPVAVTTEQLAPAATAPISAPPTEELPADAPRLLDTDDTLLGRFRVGAVSGIGLVTGMAALFGMFLRVVAIRTDASAPAFATGDWMVADLGTNLPGAMLVALVALLVGVIGAGFRQRWAAGLAGGAGLAIAGWVTLTIGLADRPLEAAMDAVGRPTTEAFTVTITRDVGYWVLLAAGVLGVVTFVVSLASAGRDPARRGLNPWIASLGAVAAVVAAAGPLIPEGVAAIEDNWSPGTGGLGQPTWYVVGRLVQLGLLAYAGVIGFLLVRSYGLGLVIGGVSASVWLALSTLVDLGEAPIGPGFANPGSTGPVDLHAVTIVGMTALVGLVVVAVIAAVEQSARDSR